ncbi:MAG: winged helix-turn-helix domain-containing protein [Candidatus Bathyarchaeota archaeon]|nr:winged helix-turn-helix domain-containing protein [Candidatus Bathyarchaeota archaeon]
MKEFSNEAYYLIFSTLANRTRLAIIDTLRELPKTITEISTAIKQEQTIVSTNLKQLEKSALVTSEISGNKQLYSLNREIVEPLAHVLELHTAKHCPGLRVCIPKEKLKEYMKKEAAKETFIEH